MNRIFAFGILLKPKVILAMAALYVTAYLGSVFQKSTAAFDFQLFVLGLIAVLVSVAGANALNCYLDRDIDSVMARTQGRRVAIDVLGANEALISGILFLGVASGLSLILGVIPSLLLFVGVAFYLVIYTLILKRRTPYNVFSTLPSIASPAVFGWFLGGAPFFPIGLLVVEMVSVWGPLHLWTLAYVFSNDYERVKVPMLPSIVSKGTASKLISFNLVIQVVSSYLLAIWAKSLLFVIGISVLNMIIIFYGYEFYKEKSNETAYRLFKLSAPYIIIILSLFVVDKLV